MDENTMEMLLREALARYDEWEHDEEYQACAYIRSIRPFSEANLLSKNRGIVIAMGDGAEFQVTIVQTKIAEMK